MTTPPPPGTWVDIASRAIVQVGFPVVVAGVLLWFLLTRFQHNMDAITTRMEANTAAMQAQTQSLAKIEPLVAKIEQDATQLVELQKDSYPKPGKAPP